MKNKKAALLIIIFAIVTPLSILPFIRAANWETVTTVTGSADQTSNSFSISAQEWRLQWSYTPDPRFPSLTFFGVLVYPQKEGATYVDSFYVNGSTQINGTEYIREGAKDYHLEILDANIPSYTIVVQQYVENSSSTPNGNSGTANTMYAILTAIIVVIITVVAVALLLRRKPEKNITPSAAITVNTVSS
jgi:hypothetical protein